MAEWFKEWAPVKHPIRAAIALTVCGTYAYLVVKGDIEPARVHEVFLTIGAFYFGERAALKTTGTDDGS